jgi:hypothetical protein
MVAYYGIGGWYKRTHGIVSDDFIKNRCACISAHTIPHTKIRREFQETFLGIKKEDNIYLKSFFIKKRMRVLRIKSIGKVICTENNQKINELGYCIEVEWDNYFPDGLKDISLNSINDGINRSTRIYKECNPDIIKVIDELIKKI